MCECMCVYVFVCVCVCVLGGGSLRGEGCFEGLLLLLLFMLLLLLLFGLDLFTETRRLTSTTTNKIIKPLFSFWPGLVIMSLFCEMARVL